MGTETLGKSEQEVLELLAQGFSDKAISNIVCLEETSIRKIVHRIYTKLEIEGYDFNKRVKATIIYWDYVEVTSGSSNT